MARLYEIFLVALMGLLGASILGLFVYRMVQFVTGFWEGLHGIEPPEQRGFDVIMSGRAPSGEKEDGGGQSD